MIRKFENFVTNSEIEIKFVFYFVALVVLINLLINIFIYTFTSSNIHLNIEAIYNVLIALFFVWFLITFISKKGFNFLSLVLSCVKFFLFFTMFAATSFSNGLAVLPIKYKDLDSFIIEDFALNQPSRKTSIQKLLSKIFKTDS